MKKRFLFVAAMAALALNIYAADGDYTVDANGVITKYAGFDTEITIPAVIGGKKITAIGSEAFRKAELTSVSIPEGITEIGSNAFAENKLTTVTIPGSVRVIKGGAFDGNKDLADVVLSEGLEHAGDPFPFTVKNINIPASIRSFDEFLNRGTSVTFAANIILDMHGVFSEHPEYGRPNLAIFFNYIANDRKAGTYTRDMKCEEKRADGYTYYETEYGAVLSKYNGDATRLRVPAQIGDVAVKAIHGDSDPRFLSGVFEGKKIVAVQIPEGITYIGHGTFKENQLQSVTIPRSVTYIGDSAFEANELTAIDISSGVRYIGSRAFFRNKLTAATIAGGVQYIGDMAFAAYEEGYNVAPEPNNLTSVTIPNSVTHIGRLAFQGSKAVTIPASVKTLGGVPISENTTFNREENNGNRIVIGANVKIEEIISYGEYGSSFGRDYIRNGRKAGRYTYSAHSGGAGTWVYSAR